MWTRPFHNWMHSRGDTDLYMIWFNIILFTSSSGGIRARLRDCLIQYLYQWLLSPKALNIIWHKHIRVGSCKVKHFHHVSHLIVMLHVLNGDHNIYMYESQTHLYMFYAHLFFGIISEQFIIFHSPSKAKFHVRFAFFFFPFRFVSFECVCVTLRCLVSYNQ